jgi:hypothetical protein
MDRNTVSAGTYDHARTNTVRDFWRYEAAYQVMFGRWPRAYSAVTDEPGCPGCTGPERICRIQVMAIQAELKNTVLMVTMMSTRLYCCRTRS